MDLSKMSDADLQAIASGDMTRVSDSGLLMLSGDKPKESEAFRKGRNAPGALRGLASVMQGPTFGFADELYGRARAAFDSSPGAYERHRDMARGAAQQESEDNPIVSTVTRLAASAPVLAAAPTFGAVRGVAAPAGLARNVGAATATGGAYGAVSGLGESTATSPEEMAADAVLGGLSGAAMSGVTQGGLGALGAVRRQVSPRLSTISAQDQARQKVAEALLRDAPTAVEQNPATAISQGVRRLQTLGPQARVVDVGDENTRRLLDLVTTAPGKTATAANQARVERQAGRAARLTEAADQGLGAGGRRMGEQVEEWVARRSQNAAPMYNELRARFANITPDDEMKAIVNAAVDVGADKTAAKIATANRQQFTLDPQGPQLRFSDLDALKQGLDDMVSRETDAVTGRVTPLGRSLVGLKQQLVGKIDEATTVLQREGDEVQAVSLYKRARDAFAGPSSLISAAEQGRKAMSMDDVSIRQAMQGLNQSEAEAFRLGAFEALRSQLGRQSGQTQLLNFWKEPATAERLRAMFGNERSYRKFIAETMRESRLKRMESVGQGSQTARRMMGAADLDTSAVGDAAQAATAVTTGNLAGLLMPLTRGWARLQTPEPVRDEIGRILLSRDPNEIRSLRDLLMDVNTARQNQIRSSGALGALTAGAMVN